MDRVLLTIFLDGSRKTFIDITKELGKYGFKVTPMTVRRRIGLLVKSGVIERFSVQLNPRKIGLPSTAFMELKVDPALVSEAQKGLSKMTEITELYTVSNEFNFIIKVMCQSSKELTKFVQRLSRTSFVREVKLHTISECTKQAGSAPKMTIVPEAKAYEADINGDGQPEVVLENPHVWITIEPHRGGRITEYFYKLTGNNHVFPTLGFLHDNFKEEEWGVFLPNQPYKCTREKSVGEYAKLSLSTILNGTQLKKVGVKKTITLHRDATDIDVEYEFTNLGESEEILTPWICNYANVGGKADAEDWFYASLEAGTYVEQFEPGYSGLFWKGLATGSGERNDPSGTKLPSMDALHVCKERIYFGWAAYHDTKTDELLGFLWDINDVYGIKRFFSTKYYSLELEFLPIRLKPKESKKYSFTFFISTGDWTIAHDKWSRKYWNLSTAAKVAEIRKVL